MTVFIALDSSLSMKSPINDEASCAITRWQAACEVASCFVKQLQERKPDECIKLVGSKSVEVDFSHNSSMLCEEVKSVTELQSVFSKVDVSASAEMLSLFSLIRMKKPEDGSRVLVITDGAAFTPEEIKLHHIPECPTRFALVLNEELTDMDQVARFVVISAHSEGVQSLEECTCVDAWSPFFLSRSKNYEQFAKQIVSELYPSDVHTLTCGMLRVPIEIIPPHYESVWDETIDIVGFVKLSNLHNAPLIDYRYVVERKGSKPKSKDPAAGADEGLVSLICSGLATEESVAICHLSGEQYGALSASRDADSDCMRLIIQVFPEGIDAGLWKPDFTKLTAKLSLNPEKEKDSYDICIPAEQYATASYAHTQRTCWNDVYGIQADIQKVLRLLKKIPDRLPQFYAEVNRLRLHACAIAADEILDVIITKLAEEGATLASPLIKKHCDHVCHKMREGGLQNVEEIVPPL
ncbi:hypothetical protein AB6A40_004177 [Gnathostoma spinigerum]|uniref:Integrator complex subunit 14 C-terminal domain-containing protein n=1 Tax=Gnathostoma spinigerum TaxID=75299 RepID=A0ABD6EBQ4_9BILA